MKRFLARASVAGLSAALVAGVALVAAPAASAAQIGALSFNGLTSQTVGFTMTTSGACPTTPTLATNFQIRISNDTTVSGNTAPTVSANITGNTAGSTIAGGINSGPFTATASANLATFAANNGLGSQLPAGTYRFDLICRTLAASASLGDFSGRVVIGTGGAITSATPILTNVTTSTSVVANPTSINTTTGTTNFTATITPSSAVGQVQFQVNGTNLPGGLVAVSGGTATFTGYTDSVAGNGKVVTANFIGGTDSSNSYSNSSGTTTLDVTQSTEPTTTTLSLSSASVTNGTSVIATATVTDSASAPVTSGNVSCSVDGTALPTSVAVNSSGVATLTINKPTGGPYSVVCNYAGTIVGGLQYQASASDPATFTVTPNTAPLYTDPQTVTVEVPAGTITIDTPYTAANPLNMGLMTLNGVAGYSAEAFFGDITVADTRAGNTAWTAQAQSGNFTKGAAGPTETISSNNVGLILNAFSTTAADFSYLPNQPAGGPNSGANNFTGFDNPAGSYLPYNNVGNQGLGGTAPHKILHANNGLGTTISSGVLRITAPTSVTAGVYTGVVTFTVIGA